MHNQEIIVSVFCLAYNHEKYIREMLEGCLMQKTDFAFEVLIHEDASTDNTAEILREYEKKYPDIIRVVYEEKNRYKTGVDYFYDILLPMARGKYIAVCEGDDAWIDDKKLQLQVDYMESHEDCSLIGHKTFLQYPGDWDRVRDYRCMGYENDGIVPYESMFTDWKIPTSSFLFRKNTYIEMPRFFMDAPTGDEPLLWFLAGKGHVYFMDRVMSVYNKMTSDSWTVRFINSAFESMAEYYAGYVRLFEEIDEYTNHTRHLFFEECIKERIRRALAYILFNSKLYDEVGSMLKTLSKACPDEWEAYIIRQQKRFWFADKEMFDQYHKGLGERDFYIYGAGGLATKFILEILPNDMKINAVLISDGQIKKDKLEGIEIKYLSEVKNTDDAFVFVAVSDEFAHGMIGNLRDAGFKSYIWIYEDVFIL